MFYQERRGREGKGKADVGADEEKKERLPRLCHKEKQGRENRVKNNIMACSGQRYQHLGKIYAFIFCQEGNKREDEGGC